MSAIEISKISFISRGLQSRCAVNIPRAVTTTSGAGFITFPLSRLNPLLMKLILLIWSGA